VATLELHALTKRYPGVVSVDAIDLKVGHGEFVCLLGPSGCGKTTTLRMIAGLAEPDDGEIRVNGRIMSSARGVVPPEQRNMSMIFQSYAVWPHMTVRENVAYGLKLKALTADEKQARVSTSGCDSALGPLRALSVRALGRTAAARRARARAHAEAGHSAPR